MSATVNSLTATQPKFSSVLSLNNLRLSVNLGVTSAERAIPQEISVSFKFYFTGVPKACTTDNVEDTVCYDEMAALVKERCHKKEYKLLECLCYLLYEGMRKKTAPDIKIWVGVEKCNPPIEGLIGATSFEYSDI